MICKDVNCYEREDRFHNTHTLSHCPFFFDMIMYVLRALQ